MNRTFILVGKDIKEAFASKSTLWYIIVLVIIAFPYFDMIKSTITGMINQGTALPIIKDAAQSAMDSMFFSLPMVLVMLSCSIFAAYAIMLDKTKRSLESLLATPLSLRQLWVAKSLAVTIPSVIIGVGVAVILVIVLNIWIFAPVAGLIIPGFQSFISGLLLIPVLTFLTVGIVAFLQFVMTNPRYASLVFSVLFIAIYLLTIFGVSASWDFSLIYVVMIAALAVINIILSRFLTKEKIVLSSKG
jgi:ABC-2 type transport system permease protein